MSQRLDHTAASPAGMKAMGHVYGYISECGLPKELIDLVFYRVSLINGCAYCIDSHPRDLLKHGMSVEKLLLVPVWHEAGPLFTDLEKAALRWTETVVHVAQTHIPDEEFAAAREYFSEKELVDLTIVIGLMNAYNFIGVGFRLPPAAVKAA